MKELAEKFEVSESHAGMAASTQGSRESFLEKEGAFALNSEGR